jgi:hypothetical protein
LAGQRQSAGAIGFRLTLVARIWRRCSADLAQFADPRFFVRGYDNVNRLASVPDFPKLISNGRAGAMLMARFALRQEDFYETP